MEFFINKKSTLPKLKLELINDGRNNFRNFYDKIQNADIYFTMWELGSGIKRIGKKLASTELVIPITCVGEEYYITYQFNEFETSKAGRYVGQFTIDFNDGTGTLLVPIREELFINILDGSIKK